jgi:Icc-related predicted phosphoesterase
MTTPTESTPVAFAGDWHGNTEWALRCVDYLDEQGDVRTLIHLGDFGFMGSIAAYLDAVHHRAEEANINIFVVPGNHENYDWIESQSIDSNGLIHITNRIHAYPRGHRVHINGVSFCAGGGADSVDKRHRTTGKSWWPQEELTDSETETIRQQDRVEVLLTHDSPYGANTPKLPQQDFIRWVGAHIAQQSEEHQRRIRKICDALQPRILIHGHYHFRYSDNHIWKAATGFPYAITIEGLDCDETISRTRYAGMPMPAVSDNLIVADIAENQLTIRKEFEVAPSRGPA